MEVKLFMAQTLNGKIAREDGGEDFLSPKNWQEFQRIAEKNGAFVVGRKTYEVVGGWDEKGFEDVDALRIVLSRNEDLDLEDGFIMASSPEEAVKIVDKEDKSGLIVTGGASVNTSFMEKGLFDEIILDIEPHVLGEGLDIFAEGRFEESLSLLEVRELGEGIVQLRYEI